MHFISTSTILSATLFAGLASQRCSAEKLKQRQPSFGILINPPGLPDLPTAPEAASVSAAAGLNLTNIQGDILVGMKKKKELFFFFSIEANSVTTFKSKLASEIYPLITTTTQLLDVSTQPVTALNIAFSQSGLTALGMGEKSLNDDFFSNGQAADIEALGDPGTDNWVPGYVDTNRLHGVFLLASDTVDNINAKLATIQSILGNSIVEIHRLQGEARPGAEEGHEHFGFLDGISQPAVEGFTASPNRGQAMVPPGAFILGADGDGGHPEWSKDGSFLAFRQLKQLVPEFNKFLTDNPVMISPLTTREQGSALMGARMVGRWKSGAPIDLTPVFDDPVLGSDPNRNNDFDFIGAADQSRCPYSAHIRKTNPRSDFRDPDVIDFSHNHIIRAGIPYGPEVTAEEAASNTTSIERGLAFVSYQSSIGKGFRFQQESWSNNPDFFHHKRNPGHGPPGYDPIIGADKGRPREVTGLDAANGGRTITLQTDFVESRGGEYFFSPPLSAIRGTLAA